MSYPLSSRNFIALCNRHNCNVDAMQDEMKQTHPGYDFRPHRVAKRIASYKAKGLLPLDSGNSVDVGEVLKGTSTLYGPDGAIKNQWVKTDVDKETLLSNLQDAVTDIIKENVSSLPIVPTPTTPLDEELLAVYISNDVHIGAYLWKEEVGTEWDLNTATTTLKSAYDHLIDTTLPTKEAIIVDLGDLTETDDYKNMTPKSGNILDVEGRYPQILRAAYESLIYGIEKALTKHETVYFYNVAGNHDLTSGIAVQEVIRVAFKNNPRVIVCESPSPIKYHQHGQTLLQFAHGDGLALKDSGEVMAYDCADIFSSTTHRYGHFGHTHKSSVVEGRLARAESHRNLMGVNAWAFHKGFRGPLGTMKSITYSAKHGEYSRQIYNVTM